MTAAGATADMKALRAADVNSSAVTDGVSTAKLTAIHAIPGLPAPVDVYVNGDYLLSFDFNESAGPLERTGGLRQRVAQPAEQLRNRVCHLTSNVTIRRGPVSEKGALPAPPFHCTGRALE